MTDYARNIRAWADQEREEGVLTRVDKHADGNYSVTSSNGWSCGVDGKFGVEPHVGDLFITWGSIGRPIRGQAIGTEVLFYRTPAEQDVENQKQVDESRAERIALFEGSRSVWEAKVAALPDVFRERIAQFRAFKGEGWCWEFGPYEVDVCREAAQIAEHFKTPDAIVAFSKLDYEPQVAAYPPLKDSGHSGNSWGMAVRLAHLYLDKPHLVPMMHGALCALVGCEDYGCYATREKANA